MKRTPLVEQHRRAGGKLVDFAGWEMPIQYGGVLEEYQAIRTAVGIFDVSHMGRVTGVVSRTGYTGEVGYELYIPSHKATPVWEALMKAGESAGIKPCGLGARDLLRLEVGYLLYGNDIDEQTTPLEAGAAFAVDFTKGDFTGRAPLLEQKEKGPAKHLIVFELLQKGVPRHGMKILADGREIGVGTSGDLSTVLHKGIGLGYVPTKFSTPGAQFEIDIRGRMHRGVVVKLPVYKRQ